MAWNSQPHDRREIRYIRDVVKFFYTFPAHAAQRPGRPHLRSAPGEAYEARGPRAGDCAHMIIMRRHALSVTSALPEAGRLITSSSTTCERRPCSEPCIDHTFQSGLTQFDTLPGTSAGSRSSFKPCAPLGAVVAVPERAVHPADPHVVQTGDALGVRVTPSTASRTKSSKPGTCWSPGGITQPTARSREA
jgi:hypothetical protein